jgi:hypothetical protein
MCTNIQKYEIVPIRCDDIDKPTILGEFQGRLTNLPDNYLGLAESQWKMNKPSLIEWRASSQAGRDDC